MSVKNDLNIFIVPHHQRPCNTLAWNPINSNLVSLSDFIFKSRLLSLHFKNLSFSVNSCMVLFLVVQLAAGLEKARNVCSLFVWDITSNTSE
jgi:hypothetical protein